MSSLTGGGTSYRRTASSAARAPASSSGAPSDDFLGAPGRAGALAPPQRARAKRARPRARARRLAALAGALLAAVCGLYFLLSLDASLDPCVYISGNRSLDIEFDTKYSLEDLYVSPGSEEVRTKSQALGAAYIPRALPDDLVDRARADITRQMLSPENHFGHIALTGFRKEQPLRLTPAIAEVVERATAMLRPAFELLGDDAVIVELTGNFAWPGAMPQRVHDDIGYDTDYFDETIQLTAFVYLDDIGPRQGATLFFPDEHHRLINEIGAEAFEAMWGVHKLCEGRHGATAVFESLGVQAVVPKGTVALYNNNLIHGGTENHSRKVRPAMVITYGASYEKLVATQTWGIDGEYFNRITLRHVLDTVDSGGGRRCYPTKHGRIEAEKVGAHANLTQAMLLAHELERAARRKATPAGRSACSATLRRLCGRVMGDPLKCMRCAAPFYHCCGHGVYAGRCTGGGSKATTKPRMAFEEEAWNLALVFDIIDDPHNANATADELVGMARSILEPAEDQCPLNQPCFWPAIERECGSVVFSDRPYAEMYAALMADEDFKMIDGDYNVYRDGLEELGLMRPEAHYPLSRLVHLLFGPTVRRAYQKVLGALLMRPAAILGLLPRPEGDGHEPEGDGHGQEGHGHEEEGDGHEEEEIAQTRRSVDFLSRMEPMRSLPKVFEGLGSPISLLAFGNYSLEYLSRPLEDSEILPVRDAAAAGCEFQQRPM